MIDRATAIAELERRIGHRFEDRDLLDRALTHASVGEGARNVSHNERLEFLGDRVLNLIIAEELLARMPEADEGEVSRAFHQLVDYESCASVARAVGLPEALRLGGGASKLGVRRSDRMLGDACEALIAALYIDGGLELARRFILAEWAEGFAGAGQTTADPKTALQHWALARGLPLPTYEVASQKGPAHKPVFVIEATVQGYPPERASGRNKQEASRDAAAALLNKLGELQ